MKRLSLFPSILALLVLSACTLPFPGGQTPTAIQAPAVAPPTEAAPTQPAVEAPAVPTATSQPPTAPTPAVEAAPTQALAAPTQALAAPTATPVPPTAEPAAAAQAQASPTAAPPATAAASPTPAATYDPFTTLGEPDYRNTMEEAYYGEWARADTETLPDDRNIRLRFKDGELYVTGKRLDWSTWWFSYHTLSDAFVQMSFDSEDCSGEDTYGMILRGSPHKAGESWGYVVAFTCSGRLWVYRLDSARPWDTEALEDAEVSAIHSGPGEQNVLGVRAEGETLVIYANGVQVATVEDDHFRKGRVGVFVRSARPGAYTYRVTDFAYWILGEDQ